VGASSSPVEGEESSPGEMHAPTESLPRND